MYIIANFFVPHCKITVLLVKNWVITNRPVYGVSYYYALCLVRITISLTLDGVQPKSSHFYTRYIIEVNYKVVHYLSRPIFILFSYLNSTGHNVVIELCRALKIFFFLSRLFSKEAHSFIAVELLAFSTMQNSFF